MEARDTERPATHDSIKHAEASRAFSVWMLMPVAFLAMGLLCLWMGALMTVRCERAGSASSDARAAAHGKRNRRAEPSWTHSNLQNYPAQCRRGGFCSRLFGADSSRAPSNRCGLDATTRGWAHLERATSLRSAWDRAVEDGQANHPVHRQSLRPTTQLLVRVVDAAPGRPTFLIGWRILGVFWREIAHSP